MVVVVEVVVGNQLEVIEEALVNRKDVFINPREVVGDAIIGLVGCIVGKDQRRGRNQLKARCDIGGLGQSGVLIESEFPVIKTARLILNEEN